MRSLIALLMLCVMLLSHESMGEAVPHPEYRGLAHADAHLDHALASHHDPEYRGLAHADAHSDHALASHHVGTVDVTDAGGSDEDRADDPLSHALHAHVVGHLARPIELHVAPLLESGLKLTAMIVQSRPSRDVAPLLEPPSA